MCKLIPCTSHCCTSQWFYLVEWFQMNMSSLWHHDILDSQSLHICAILNALSYYLIFDSLRMFGGRLQFRIWRWVQLQSNFTTTDPGWGGEWLQSKIWKVKELQMSNFSLKSWFWKGCVGTTAVKILKHNCSHSLLPPTRNQKFSCSGKTAMVNFPDWPLVLVKMQRLLQWIIITWKKWQNFEYFRDICQIREYISKT